MPRVRYSPFASDHLTDWVRRTGNTLYGLGLDSHFLSFPQVCVVLRICNPSNPSYHSPFYMITRSPLSAAAPASRGYLRHAARLQWHRHSCLCAFITEQSSRPWLPRHIALNKPQRRAEIRPTQTKFLIANLELEFSLTCLKTIRYKFLIANK